MGAESDQSDGVLFQDVCDLRPSVPAPPPHMLGTGELFRNLGNYVFIFLARSVGLEFMGNESEGSNATGGY